MSQREVLVVDDSRSARFAMRKYLEHYHYDVAAVEGPAEALGYLKTHRPFAIFLDQLMPGCNGLEVLRTLKNDPNTVMIPVVICTSIERPEFQQEARSVGALDVLPKPPRLEQLHELLQGLERASAVPATAAAPVVPPPSALLTPPPVERYAELRGQIDAGLRRLTQDIFVQMAELKAQLVRMDQAGMTREEEQEFRTIAREEAETLNDAVRKELEAIRRQLGDLDRLQRQERQEMLLAARSAAAVEASTIAERTVANAASRLSQRVADALVKALGKQH